MQPNKERIQKWVDALRSGKYTQGKGQLKNGKDQYCCLGVGCDIAKKDLKIKWVKDDNWNECSFMGVEDSFPYSVAEYYGLSDNPILLQSTEKRASVSCIQANDDMDKTFREIADLIEAKYLKE